MPDSGSASSSISSFSIRSDFEAFQRLHGGLKSADDKQFSSVITSPSGDEAPVQILEDGDDSYSIGFSPKETGLHTTIVLYKGEHIPGSPFRFNVEEPYDGGAEEIKMWGPGLKAANVNQPATFDIWTTKAGCGPLSISVEGPSKPNIDFKDREDGLCGVSYVVTEPGQYEVCVLFNETHAAGSPFTIEAVGKGTGPSFPRVQLLRGHSDPSKVTTSGPGIEKATVGQETSFTVDCSSAGSNMLVIGVIGPTTPCEDVSVKHSGEKRYIVTYTPKEMGEFTLIVKWGEENVPNSPFCVQVE